MLYCFIALLIYWYYCDFFIYHPFNISSFPTSLKNFPPFPLSFRKYIGIIGDMYIDPKEWTNVPALMVPNSILPLALLPIRQIYSIVERIYVLLCCIHPPLVVYWNVSLYDEMQSWHSIMMLNYPIRIQKTQHIENFYYKHNKYHYLLLPLSSTYRTVTAYSK